jgi:hypothetical protein
MPLTFRYLNERRGVACQASGILTGDELIAALTEINSPTVAATRPIVYSFSDFSGVLGMEVSADQVHVLANLAVGASRHMSVKRVAAIHAKDDLPFGLSRMYHTLIEPADWETEIFRERADAAAWIRERVAAKFGIRIEFE